MLGKKTYILTRNASFDTTTSMFQFKILHNSLLYNKTVFNFIEVSSPLCLFCKSHEETVNLYYGYLILQQLWNQLKLYFRLILLLLLSLRRVQFSDFLRSSRPEVFCKKSVLRNFTKFTGKHLCQGLFFNKVAGLRAATLLKKRLWHRCFAENFGKYLRTPFFSEHLRWLLLFLNTGNGHLI